VARVGRAGTGRRIAARLEAMSQSATASGEAPGIPRGLLSEREPIQRGRKRANYDRFARRCRDHRHRLPHTDRPHRIMASRARGLPSRFPAHRLPVTYICP